MKNTPAKDLSEYRQTASRLKALLSDGMMVEGSLCRAKTGGRERWQLTRKAGGRTETLYVPDRDAEAVRAATERRRLARELFRALGETAWRTVRERLRSRPAPSSGPGAGSPPRPRTGGSPLGS